MTRPFPLLVLTTVMVGGLWLSGCGGQSSEPKSTAVITPPSEATEAAEEAADTPTNVAASQPEESPPEPAEEPMPEEPAPEVAATTPEPEPPAASNPETTASKPVAAVESSAAATDGAVPASVALGAAPGGTVFKGRVVVKGTAAAAKPTVPNKDAFCIALGEVPNDSLIVSDDGGMANVIVWLRKLPAGAEVPPVPEDAVVLDNVNCSFKPHAFVLRVGQKMLIKNADPTAHNTRISPIRNNAFNQTIAPNDRKGVEVVYQQPELVPIKTQCDIHPWMGSFHFPVDHPWAAVTDADGNFEITGLPAGDLVFRLWHERMGYVERSVKVTLADGETAEQTFEVDAAKLAE